MNNTTLSRTPENIEVMLNDCSIDAIIAIDIDQRIIAWNRTAEKIYEKTRQDVLGRLLVEIIPSIGEDKDSLTALKNAEGGMKSFVPASRTYHHRVRAENHFIPLKDKGEVVGIMNIVHDVSHRIKAEEQLQRLNDELEKRYRQLKVTSDELASYTYITSNKIKEPIRQIYTGIENLIRAEASKLSNMGKASFRRFQSSINRMDLLLNDMLSLSEISILEKPVNIIDLNEAVEESRDLLKEKIVESNAIINVGHLCEVRGHKEQMLVLIAVLIDNAIKFNSSSTPKVDIECSTIEIRKESGLFEKYERYYDLKFSDNGIGFDNVDAEKIFRMFEKLNDQQYKGTGMGLAIASKIMEAHDGFITAESTEAGAIFHCFFPVVTV